MGQHSANPQHDQARAPKGTPTGGRWVSDVKPQDDVQDLRASQVPWESIPTPNVDQVARAAEHARRGLAWHGGNLSPAELRDRTDQIARQLAEQEAAFEAWKAGETHPDDELYANIWAGNAPGTNEAMVKATLDALNQRYDELEEAGNADPAELQRMDEEFTLYEQALACEGRNLSINQSNVVRTNRLRERVPF